MRKTWKHVVWLKFKNKNEISKNSYMGVNNHSKSKKKVLLHLNNLVNNFQNQENTQSHLLFCKEETWEQTHPVLNMARTWRNKKVFYNLRIQSYPDRAMYFVHCYFCLINNLYCIWYCWNIHSLLEKKNIWIILNLYSTHATTNIWFQQCEENLRDNNETFGLILVARQKSQSFNLKKVPL